MEMRILHRKGQYPDISIGRANPNQIESHAEILIVMNELRRQFAVGTKMIIMGIIFPLKK
jgi:hypothetical protein